MSNNKRSNGARKRLCKKYYFTRYSNNSPTYTKDDKISYTNRPTWVDLTSLFVSTTMLLLLILGFVIYESNSNHLVQIQEYREIAEHFEFLDISKLIDSYLELDDITVVPFSIPDLGYVDSFRGILILILGDIPTYEWRIYNHSLSNSYYDQFFDYLEHTYLLIRTINNFFNFLTTYDLYSIDYVDIYGNDILRLDDNIHYMIEMIDKTIFVEHMYSEQLWYRQESEKIKEILMPYKKFINMIRLSPSHPDPEWYNLYRKMN